MKKSTFCYLSLVFLFFSCSGTAHLPVPGEKNAVESNISVEYYSIASSYEELKNYKKAIDYYNLAKKIKKCGLLLNTRLHAVMHF